MKCFTDAEYQQMLSKLTLLEYRVENIVYQRDVVIESLAITVKHLWNVADTLPPSELTALVIEQAEITLDLAVQV